MISFKELTKYHPKLEHFESIPSTFWEELYQVFKTRIMMELETMVKIESYAPPSPEERK